MNSRYFGPWHLTQLNNAHMLPGGGLKKRFQRIVAERYMESYIAVYRSIATALMTVLDEVFPRGSAARDISMNLSNARMWLVVGQKKRLGRIVGERYVYCRCVQRQPGALWRCVLGIVGLAQV